MTEFENDDDWISKSQRKRDCDNVLELGEVMIALNKEELAQIEMDSNLRHALEEAQRIKSHGALKRQRHYIAKILRGLDDETLEPQVTRILHKHDIYNAEFKRMEKWRDTMLDAGDQGINDFLGHYPQADRHHLRQLVRNAKKEQLSNKPASSYRQIFKYIREISDQTSAAEDNKT